MSSERTGTIVWITGRPSAGKSTFAARLARQTRQTRPVCVLDGDAVRAALCPTPGYGDEDRRRFYTTLINLAVLLAEQGFVVVVPATAPQREIREKARAAHPSFIEVFVNTPSTACEERDSKGLYAKARQGVISDLPAVDVIYEEPHAPEVVASGGHDERALHQTCELIARDERSQPVRDDIAG